MAILEIDKVCLRDTLLEFDFTTSSFHLLCFMLVNRQVVVEIAIL